MARRGSHAKKLTPAKRLRWMHDRLAETYGTAVVVAGADPLRGDTRRIPYAKHGVEGCYALA